MRLADVVFRRGHLSERALVEVWLTGDRPVHLDRCDLCAERAVELGRWLDEARSLGLEAADAVFPPERLAAQQSQILRRLAQLDEPARVLAFPSQYRLEPRETGSRKVAPAWVGVAAAAGLVLGVFGGYTTASLGRPGDAASLQAGVDLQPLGGPSVFDLDLEHVGVPYLEAMNEITPTVVSTPARSGS